MEIERVNMFGVRKQLGIESLRAKIEKRSLQRVGHVLRMPNDRLTKRICLGWYRREGRRSGKQTTIHYWRKLVREAGIDPDNVEIHANNRTRWKKQIKVRMKRIREWEEHTARKHGNNEQEVESMTRNMKRNPAKESLRCDWNNCGRLCKTKAGLKANQRTAHREKSVTFNCCKCGGFFNSHGAKQNHAEICQGATRGTCAHCLRILNIPNMARHKRHRSRLNEAQTVHAYKEKLGEKREKKECSVCGKMTVKSNMA